MKIPVILVTGFLGSGKTTLLRRMAESLPDWHMTFLVNEFADSSIDELTLDTTGTPTQSVVGGSLFCECKAGEFVRVMKEQVLTQHQAETLDAVVIETSGIADPEAIGELMSLHGLAENFEIQRIVCVVAAKRFLSLLKNLPTIQAQIRTSDLIIINKTDLAKSAVVDQVESAIHETNPNAELLRAERCAVDFSLGQIVRELPNHPLFTCDANPYSTETITWPEACSIDEARNWLNALPETILRVKGTLRASDQSWRVEKTVDTLEIDAISDFEPNQLILIAHDDHEADLQTALQSVIA
jgi:G3E family GTPase